MKDTKQLGHTGEAVAAKYLIEKKGFGLIGHNIYVEWGEIDLLMWDPAYEEYVLVEVKTRRNENFGHPEEAISREKLRKLISAARKYFLGHKKMTHLPHFRIDGVGVTHKNGQYTCEHWENIAF